MYCDALIRRLWALFRYLIIPQRCFAGHLPGTNIFTVCNLTKAIRKAIFRGSYLGVSLTNHCYDVVNSNRNWRNYIFVLLWQCGFLLWCWLAHQEKLQARANTDRKRAMHLLFVTTGLQILALLKPSGLRQLSSELVHASL